MVYRAERKPGTFTVMSNYHLRDKRLSLQAKGLFTIMLSLPDTWEYSIAGLMTLSTSGRKCVQTSLKELENLGYLYRCKKRKSNHYDFGGWDYAIYEEATTPKASVAQASVAQASVAQASVAKDQQYNTKVYNNKVYNNKKYIVDEKGKQDKYDMRATGDLPF